MNIDLTAYVVNPWGEWHKDKEKGNITPSLLRLTAPDDGVTLVGPLRVRVSVQARNNFTLIGTSSLAVQAKDVFSYILDIPPGQSWTYPSPAALSREAAASEAVAGGGTDALRADLLREVNANISATLPTPRYPSLFGANGGYIVVIRPAGPDVCADPCAPDPCAPADPCAPRDPCAPKKKECHCDAPGEELPCDFAVANHPNLGAFFPAPCEPCAPGASIGMPPVKGPALIVPPARGGTMRTRYFNGMFIASEDLETDWRNVRLKRALMNRAMGQGVVWGLGICQDGEAICVLPGYGVDCCGSDIVISSPYRVDSQALLRDPAAAAALATRGPHRMHLLLEYFECPEQPRPVHGDPCSPETTRCEMSRIRETARLRLVPPCDVDDSGPIKDFLNEVAKLKQDRSVGPLFVSPTVVSAVATPVAAPAPTPAPMVPFDVQVLSATDPTDTVTLQPPVAPPPAQDDVGVQPAQVTIAAVPPFGRVRITLNAKGDFRFATSSVVKTLAFDPNTNPNPQAINIPVTPTLSSQTQIVWEDDIAPRLTIPNPGSADPIPPAFAYQVQQWKMTDTSGNAISAASTEIDLTLLVKDTWQSTPWGQGRKGLLRLKNFRYILHIAVPPTRVDVQVPPPPPPAPYPCSTEACDPAGAARFPVPVPWLHADPAKSGSAADPRVIVLAILYAWLASETAKNKVGTPQEVQSQKLQLAAALYTAAFKLFYATVPDTERYQLTDALQRLLQAWCKALLYPGPTCECEYLCGLHGVIIGCALVDGGEIQYVDPWGGRRWVVHYPLLSYWGKQFGIMPLDAIASKFFELICCISGLPAPRPPQGPPTVGVATSGRVAAFQPTGRSSTVNLGNSVLIFDQPDGAKQKISDLGLEPARTVNVSSLDFVAQVVEAIKAPPTAPAAGPLIHYTVIGMPELHFIAPEERPPQAAPLPGGTPAPDNAPPPGSAPRDGRLAGVVRSAIESRSARSSVPPLLRSFAVDLTRGLLAALPLEPAVEAERPTVNRLVEAGAATVGDLLDGNPDDLQANVFAGESAGPLANVLEKAEKNARAMAKTTGDVVLAFATERGVVSRDEFSDPVRQGELSQRLAERLAKAKTPIDVDTVAKAVARAVVGRG